MSVNLGEVMMISFAGMGITFDKQDETQESLTLYISVPEHSYSKDVNGIEMSGENLARRYKRVLVELGVKRLTVRFKIRKGEFWTKEDKERAELEIKKKLYKSQY